MSTIVMIIEILEKIYVPLDDFSCAALIAFVTSPSFVDDEMPNFSSRPPICQYLTKRTSLIDWAVAFVKWQAKSK